MLTRYLLSCIVGTGVGLLPSVAAGASPAPERPPSTQPAPETGLAVRTAVASVIERLGDDQRSLAAHEYDPAAIRMISLFPGVRVGARFGDLDRGQRERVTAVLATLFSERGVRQAEKVFDQGRGAAEYFFARFTDDAERDDLVWRVEGHHFSVTMFVDKKHMVRPGTLLIGGQPGEIWDDLARASREIYASMDDGQRRTATVRSAPRRTGHPPFGDPVEEQGVAWSRLSKPQQERVRALLDGFRALFRPEALAQADADFSRNGGFDALRVTFAGDPASPDGEFFCGISGAGMHCEFDNRDGHVHMLLHFAPGTLHEWKEASDRRQRGE